MLTKDDASVLHSLLSEAKEADRELSRATTASVRANARLEQAIEALQAPDPKPKRVHRKAKPLEEVK